MDALACSSLMTCAVVCKLSYMAISLKHAENFARNTNIVKAS